jgi:hypothetical protein
LKTSAQITSAEMFRSMDKMSLCKSLKRSEEFAKSSRKSIQIRFALFQLVLRSKKSLRTLTTKSGRSTVSNSAEVLMLLKLAILRISSSSQKRPLQRVSGGFLQLLGRMLKRLAVLRMSLTRNSLKLNECGFLSRN